MDFIILMLILVGLLLIQSANSGKGIIATFQEDVNISGKQ